MNLFNRYIALMTNITLPLYDTPTTYNQLYLHMVGIVSKTKQMRILNKVTFNCTYTKNFKNVNEYLTKNACISRWIE